MKYLYFLLASFYLVSCSHNDLGLDQQDGELRADPGSYDWQLKEGLGSIEGYYRHGYLFSVNSDKSMTESCISGRFLTSDIQSGKIDEFEKFHGKKVSVYGKIELSWEIIDGVNYDTNVQNYCANDYVIIGMNVEEIRD